MGQPFQASFVERFVGHCDSCGFGSRGAGVRSARTATICWNCCEQIARVVNERTSPLPAGAPPAVHVEHIEADGVAWPTPAPEAAVEAAPTEGADAADAPKPKRKRRKA